MAIQYPKPHHGHVSEYQVSGFPFVTSSAWNEVRDGEVIRVSFPYVTQWFEVTSWGYGGIKVGFTENGLLGTITNNSFSVQSGSLSTEAQKDAINQPRVKYNLRCKELFITGISTNDDSQYRRAAFTVVAGLTNVPSSQFPTLTGSNGFEGVG